MKNTITALFLSMFAASAFAQQVSASYEIPAEVLPTGTTQDDVSAPSVAASVGTLNCCAVSVPSQRNQQEDDSDSLAMAGLGFGLVSLVGVTKLARRKKQM
jgi:hypothetical protein